MNEYKFEDLRIGQEESFCFEITAEKMDAFGKLVGDYNPLHSDDFFARKHGFKDRVVYGMLSASLISTFGGVYLPGKYCLIQQIDSKFIVPVYVGDRLVIKGTVKELNKSVRQAVIKIEMKNQMGEKVIRAILYAGFLE